MGGYLTHRGWRWHGVWTWLVKVDEPPKQRDVATHLPRFANYKADGLHPSMIRLILFFRFLLAVAARGDPGLCKWP